MTPFALVIAEQLVYISCDVKSVCACICGISSWNLEIFAHTSVKASDDVHIILAPLAHELGRCVTHNFCDNIDSNIRLEH